MDDDRPLDEVTAGADGDGRPPQGPRRRIRLVLAGTALAAVAAVTGTVLVLTGGRPGSAPAAAPPAAPASSRVPQPRPARPVPRAAPVLLAHSRPVSVQVPTLGIAAPLVDLGLNPDGTLQVPTDFSVAGWYSSGPFPGDLPGPPALVVGHVDSYHGAAVFFRLRQIAAGDKIVVRRADGSRATFVVYAAHHYAKASFPAAEVYAPSQRAELRLITCTGSFDRQRLSYLENLVVYATLDAGQIGASR